MSDPRKHRPPSRKDAFASSVRMEEIPDNPQRQGSLSLVATPIGNLEDITLRALRVLREADVIYAEDTRRTRILLDAYQIKKRLESYHIFNEHGKTPELLRRILEEGKNAVLVSDAGMPCIADPGFLLMRSAVAAGIQPVIVPGVSALTFSVAASALPSEKFTFFGFLPVKSGRRAAVLDEVAAEKQSSVLFESPFRIDKLLREIRDKMGKDTSVALIREATKIHEEILRGTVGEILESTAGRRWKGECVLVVGKNTPDADGEKENGGNFSYSEGEEDPQN